MGTGGSVRFCIVLSERLTDGHVLELLDTNVIRARTRPDLFQPLRCHGILLLDTQGLIIRPDAPVLEPSLLRLHNGMLLLNLVISINF